MAGRGGKWLIGCGLGCAAVALIAVSLAASGFFWLRGTLRGFDEAVETGRALDKSFGRADAFLPWPDGTIPPDRMEIFLQVREATAPYRVRIAKFFTLIPDDPEEVRRLESGSALDKLRFGLRVGRAGLGMGEQLAEFFRARNRALLEAGMGLGEYGYVYVTAFYAWLGHPPSDGPGETTVTIEGAEMPAEAEARGNWRSSRVRLEFLAQLRKLSESAGGATGDWADRLAAEIAALENDPRRIPWGGDVPRAIRVSLEPYRERLEATYSAATNAFELGRHEKRGLSIHVN